MYLSKLPLGYIIRRCSFLLLLEPLVEANTNQSLESLQGKAPPQAMSPDSPATAARFMRLGMSPAKTGTAKALSHLKKDIASFKASLPKSPPMDPRSVLPRGIATPVRTPRSKTRDPNISPKAGGPPISSPAGNPLHVHGPPATKQKLEAPAMSSDCVPAKAKEAVRAEASLMLQRLARDELAIIGKYSPPPPKAAAVSDIEDSPLMSIDPAASALVAVAKGTAPASPGTPTPGTGSPSPLPISNVPMPPTNPFAKAKAKGKQGTIGKSWTGSARTIRNQKGHNHVVP